MGGVFVGFADLVLWGEKERGDGLKKVLTGWFDMLTKPPHPEGMERPPRGKKSKERERR